MVKKWDIIVIVFLVLVSFTPQLVFGVFMGRQYSDTYAEITIDGSFYKSIPLSAHSGTEEFTIKTDAGTNVVRIVDQTIQVIDADCKDHICVQEGAISKPGETIVCLPHKLLIEVKSHSHTTSDIIPAG